MDLESQLKLCPLNECKVLIIIYDLNEFIDYLYKKQIIANKELNLSELNIQGCIITNNKIITNDNTFVIDIKSLYKLRNKININWIYTPKCINYNTIYCATDGGCRSNGKKEAKASWAFYIKYYKNKTWYEFTKNGMVKQNPTNNRAELTAIYKALKYLSKYNQEINIISDSKIYIYVIQKVFYDNNLLKKYKNSDLLEKILKYMNHNIKFIRVHSHFSHKKKRELNQPELFYVTMNEIADKNASILLKKNL